MRFGKKQNREWPSKRSEQANVRSKSWDKRRRKHRKEINQWKSLVYSNTEARNAAEIGVNILMKACISKQESGLRSSCAQACSSIPIAFLGPFLKWSRKTKPISGIKPENVRSNTINQNDPKAARKLQKEVKEYKYDHGQYEYGVLLGSI